MSHASPFKTIILGIGDSSTMKKTYLILEITYAALLWGFFQFYLENKEYDFDPDIASSLFAGLLFLILTSEWLRRKQYQSDRPKYEKYFYLPTMFVALIFAMFYVNSLSY